MRRCCAAFPACLLGFLALQGCAGSPVARSPSRFDDPSYGLSREARHVQAGPLEARPEWGQWLTLADERTVPHEVAADNPVDALDAGHPTWTAESPMVGRPRRGRFFLSGFAAGFMSRLAYGAYAGSSSHGVSSSDLGSAILIGAVTGAAVWGFSFRMPEPRLPKESPYQALPSVEKSSVYREWSTLRE